MAGIFRQLASILPGNGVCTGINVTFILEMRKPGSECYSSLVAAWDDAINQLEHREPALYESHQRFRFGDEVCKAFAITPDHNLAPLHTGKILASIFYPAYAQVPQVKQTWQLLIECANTAAVASNSLNRKFSDLNPRCYQRFLDSRKEPFSTEFAIIIHAFLEKWIAAHDIRW